MSWQIQDLILIAGLREACVFVFVASLAMVTLYLVISRFRNLFRIGQALEELKKDNPLVLSHSDPNAPLQWKLDKVSRTARSNAGFPVVRMMYNGDPVQVAVHKFRGEPSGVKVIVLWPFPEFRLQIERTSLRNRLQKRLLNLEEHELGDPKFDARYQIQSSHSDRVEAVFTDGSRTELLSLNPAEICETTLCELSIVGQTFSVDAEMSKIDRATLSLQVEKVLEIRNEMVAGFDAVKDLGLEEVGLNDQDAVIHVGITNATSEDVSCLVCGQEIEEDYVRCQKCSTPHHLDCWEYLTQCSTFACGCTKTKTVKNER